MSLLLTPSAYSRDTPEEFVIKLTKFQFLTPTQRRTVLSWYRGYQDSLRTAYQEGLDYVGKTDIPSWLFPLKPIGFAKTTRATPPNSFL